MSSKYRYIINEESLAITMYTTDQILPFLFQPYYPDSTPFENKEAAENWAKNLIYNLENPQPQPTGIPDPSIRD